MVTIALASSSTLLAAPAARGARTSPGTAKASSSPPQTTADTNAKASTPAVQSSGSAKTGLQPPASKTASAGSTKERPFVGSPLPLTTAATTKRQSQPQTVQGAIAYTRQDYIDALINQGFYELQEGAGFAGLVSRQEQSIAAAKQVAAFLKLMAKNDPNQKYILFRVNELESQISLEEHEVWQQRQTDRRKMSNHLVDVFNAEVAHSRPDFAGLSSLEERMASVDPGKADELNASIRDRSRNISREALQSAESAITAANLDQARRELDYCNTNMGYLQVPSATFEQLSARLRSMIDLKRERSMIESQVKRASALVSRDSLGAAMDLACDARSRLGAVRLSLPREEWKTQTLTVRDLIAKIEAKENLLVANAMEILHLDGIAQALVYHDEVLRRRGVSRIKCMDVNSAIFDYLIAQSRKSTQDTVVSKEARELMDGNESTSLSVNDIALAAKKKAQARSDSLRNAQARSDRKSRRAQRREERRREHDEETRIAENSSEARESASTRQASATRVERAAAPEPCQAASMELATQKMIEIYMLLEQSKFADAQREFTSNQKQFRNCLIKEAYEALQASTAGAAASGAAP